jgi:hypothetical protein
VGLVGGRQQGQRAARPSTADRACGRGSSVQPPLSQASGNPRTIAGDGGGGGGRIAERGCASVRVEGREEVTNYAQDETGRDERPANPKWLPSQFNTGYTTPSAPDKSRLFGVGATH